MGKLFRMASVLVGLLTLGALGAWAQAAPGTSLALACDFTSIAGGKVPDTAGRVIGEAVGAYQSEVSEIGPCLRFDGTAAITVPPRPELEVYQDFTASFWCQLTALPKSGEGAEDRVYLASRVGCWWLLLNIPDRTLTVVFDHQVGKEVRHDRITSRSALALNTWYHLVLRYSATEKQLALYVNGVKDAERAEVNPLRPVPAVPLDLGGIARSGAYGFHGRLAHFRLYSGNVSPDQVCKDALPDFTAIDRTLAGVVGAARNPAVKREAAAARAALGGLQGKAVAGSAAMQQFAGVLTAVARQTQLTADLAKAGERPFAQQEVLPYVVPAISPVKRLPDVMPTDGQMSDRVALDATPGEYEPASFVLYPLADVAHLEVRAGELRAATGVIPAANVDIKVVKCWFQAGSSWDSLVPLQSWPVKLTPELLLNDENMIKVVYEDTQWGRIPKNYLRVQKPEGTVYMWDRQYTPPGTTEQQVKIPPEVYPEVFPIMDAETLQPAALTKYEAKQFWITVKVPEGLPAGTYTGQVALIADGASLAPLTLTVRVLPFTLPQPKTYYDLTRTFFAGFYGGGQPRSTRPNAKITGNSRTDDQLLAEYRNRVAHNDLFPLVGGTDDTESIRKLLALRKQAGLPSRPLVSGWRAWDFEWQIKDFDKYVERVLSTVEAVEGHRDVYFFGVDEAPRWQTRQELPFWDVIKAHGGKVAQTGGLGQSLNLWTAGNVQDWLNMDGLPRREYADRWHAVGGIITNYAAPFSGPENPDLSRRNMGLLLYKANYDGTTNYTWYEGGYGFVWNDLCPGFYRSFCMVYPTINGVIDTLAWEGYREGIDDIRYATLLKQVAAQALTGSAEARQAAKAALNWLEVTDEKTADLNAVRREMIAQILKLKALIR